MSLPVPQKSSLVSQCAAIIREQIRIGEWKDWLPSERYLTEKLRVSRNTVRFALLELKEAEVVESVRGKGYRITMEEQEGENRSTEKTIGILAPEPTEQARPYIVLEIESLRALGARMGFKVGLFSGKHYFGANCGRNLERLTSSQKCDCWILVFSNARVQRWFSARRIHCVVSGHCDPSIKLPCVSADFRALATHAAGRMLSLGHRRICYVQGAVANPGSREVANAFEEAVAKSKGGAAKLMVVTCESDVAAVVRSLKRVMDGDFHPTAFFVLNPMMFLTVFSFLSRQGVRIPEDVSLVTTFGDPFLAHLTPEPTRYVYDIKNWGTLILEQVRELVEKGSVSRRSDSLMPDFVKGGSLAKCRE